MVTQLPRLNVVVESQLFKEIQKLAKKRGVSMSLMARDLLKEAIERQEDIYWDKAAVERDKSLHSKKTLSHKDVWS